MFELTCLLWVAQLVKIILAACLAAARTLTLKSSWFIRRRIWLLLWIAVSLWFLKLSKSISPWPVMRYEQHAVPLLQTIILYPCILWNSCGLWIDIFDWADKWDFIQLAWLVRARYAPIVGAASIFAFNSHRRRLFRWYYPLPVRPKVARRRAGCCVLFKCVAKLPFTPAIGSVALAKWGIRGFTGLIVATCLLLHHARRDTFWRVFGPFVVKYICVDHRHLWDAWSVTNAVVLPLLELWKGTIYGLVEVEVIGALKFAVFFDDLFVLVNTLFYYDACKIQGWIEIYNSVCCLIFWFRSNIYKLIRWQWNIYQTERLLKSRLSLA